MKLLIDIGNSRLKWAVWDGSQLHDVRAREHAQSDAADYDALWTNIQNIESVWIAAVAAPQVGDNVADSLRNRFRCKVQFVCSQARACGVSNAYERPGDLGVDRFLGLIAAHAQARVASVIAGCGTALTLDAVGADGTHLGGLIAPGIRMMHDALQKGTARLGQADAHHLVEIANNTADAVASGIHLATIALIERFVARATERFGAQPRLLLAGGDATKISTLLTIPHRIEADIVLRGLAVYADTQA